MSKKIDVMDLTSTAKKRKKVSKIKSHFSVQVPSKKKLERELATAKFEKEIEDQKKKNAHIAAPFSMTPPTSTATKRKVSGRASRIELAQKALHSTKSKLDMTAAIDHAAEVNLRHVYLIRA